MSSPDKDKFSALIEWLLQGGSEFPDLYMKRYSENNRGAHCKTHIPGDKVVMRIPKQYLINVAMGKACPIGRKMITGRCVRWDNACVSLHPRQQLIILVCPTALI